MFRFVTATLLALALAFPLAALAEGSLEKAPEASIVAASEDALAFPVPRAAPRDEAPRETSERPKRAPRGSSQSAASFRFEMPYAFPQQTLPVVFPGSFGTIAY